MGSDMTTTDVVVIGGGVMGAAAALELRKAGLQVLVVERQGAAGHGSSGASSAIVRFNYSTFDGVATAWESHACWERWTDHLGVKDPAGTAAFVRTGMVMLDAPIIPRDRFIPLFDEVGVPYEEWDDAMLHARVPGIDTGRYWPPKPVDADAFFEDSTETIGGLFTADAGYIDDPQLATQNLAYAAASRGVDFRFRSTVVAIVRDRGRVSGVKLADGSVISAPIVINAAGPWSSAVNALADVGEDFTIAVRPMRQEVHEVPADKGFLDIIVGDIDLGTYIRPTPGGALLVGGTEPECDPFEWLDDPDSANPRATRDRFDAQSARAARRFPDLRVPTAPRGVAGVYDVADDWAPIYDRTGLDGYYVMMGTSGNQFKNAPLAGRFIATIVDGVENGRDHDADPFTYRGEHTGNVINLGAFSRRRALNENSSKTVMG